ncbi:MAG: helix-hairpin-helix domain-containing protein [Desulfuromonadaceae bacterium]|nr:helix-hairpin-helix domain-containing protein [Desulfuromonadaceae bacterium]
MNFFSKTALIAVSLLFSAGLSLAAGVNSPATDLKGVAKPAKEGAKADAGASAVSVKQNVKGKTFGTKAAAKAVLVDINTATEGELRAVPGIGAAYAAKVIAGRPYANKAQLKSRKVLPQNIYEQAKDRIIARHLKK